MLDPGLPAVKLFDAEGAYQHEFGRPGQGPGDYTRAAPAEYLIVDSALTLSPPWNYR